MFFYLKSDLSNDLDSLSWQSKTTGKLQSRIISDEKDKESSLFLESR